MTAPEKSPQRLNLESMYEDVDEFLRIMGEVKKLEPRIDAKIKTLANVPKDKEHKTERKDLEKEIDGLWVMRRILLNKARRLRRTDAPIFNPQNREAPE